MRITVDLSRAYAAIKRARMDEQKLQSLGERGAMMLFQDSSQSFIRQASTPYPSPPRCSAQQTLRCSSLS